MIDQVRESGKNRAVSASFWTVAGYGTSQMLRLGGNILLAKLLLPHAFGVMALINIFVQGLTMFSDLGIGPSIIQNRRGDERHFLNTAWTIQVLRGFGLWMFSCLLAWPMAAFYAEPLYLGLLPLAGLTAVLQGFESTGVFTARRHLRLRRVTIFEIASQSVGLAATCLLAWLYPSVWALVLGLLIGSAMTTLTSYFLDERGRNWFHWDREASHELFRFGKWIFVSTIITFFAMQCDRLALGKLVPAETLGLYSIALAIAILPTMLLGTLCHTVLYPLLSESARKSTPEMARRLSTARELLLSVGLVLLLCITMEADTFFGLLYNEHYQQAGHIAQLMAAWVWIQILSTTLTNALLAIGDTRSVAAHNFARFAGTFMAILVGYRLYGLDGFIIGLAWGALLGHAVAVYCLARHGVNVLLQDMMYSSGLLAVAGVSYAAVHAAASLHPVGGQVVTVLILFSAIAWALAKLRRLMSLKPAH